MPDAHRKFESDMGAWVAKAKGRLQAFVQEFSQDLAEEIVTKTPRDTGFAVNNWSAYLNDDYKPWEATALSNDGKNPVYSDTPSVFARLTMVLHTAVPGDVIHLVNNCSYIRVLEDGFETRQGRHFIKAILNNTDEIAKKVIERITK